MSKRPRDDGMAKQLHNAVEVLMRKVPDLVKAVEVAVNIEAKAVEIMKMVESSGAEREAKLRKIEKDTREKELGLATESAAKFNKVVVPDMEIQMLRNQIAANIAQKAKLAEESKTATRTLLSVELVKRRHTNDEKFAKVQAEYQSLLAEKGVLAKAIQDVRADIEAQKRLTSDITRFSGSSSFTPLYG